MNIRTTAGSVSSQIRAIIDDLRHLEGPLLPILHAIQDAFGYIPEEAKPIIAGELNLSRAEVHGVISFYHDFRAQPTGRHVLKLCRAEACQSMGGEQLAATLLARLGVDWHGTTPDNALTVEPVYCLGLCAMAPACMLDGQPIARLDEDCLTDIAGEVRR
ncbi:formate dehydrogenase subunit gamma [Ciceribacter sp. L1K23]|uniref:formate dehydrogenase subunit gamma n=1 Tax=Ciceribacter sp. L1K23 TaxID=2820276 RepID=UPI001B83152E|nr:formate dehydrogenase subunit gamma [Ciceribacter sp. L1K23]MBR0554194.1 formate dehydrogenase subunit gamma [Ciceribacter sp. L1K23]